MTRCLLLLTAVWVLSCAPKQFYVKPHASFPASRQALVSAVRSSILAQGWTLVRQREGYVEALVNPEALGAVLSRERWKFSVRNGVVEVERIFEVQFDGNPAGKWESSRQVCDTYAYLKEIHQLERLLPVLVAQQIGSM